MTRRERRDQLEAKIEAHLDNTFGNSAFELDDAVLQMVGPRPTKNAWQYDLLWDEVRRATRSVLKLGKWLWIPGGQWQVATHAPTPVVLQLINWRQASLVGLAKHIAYLRSLIVARGDDDQEFKDAAQKLIDDLEALLV